jgi:hypothetical protein
VTESAPALHPRATQGRDTGDVNPTMTDLHDHYRRRVDDAVADDRADVIRELNEAYVEEALRLILATA